MQCNIADEMNQMSDTLLELKDDDACKATEGKYVNAVDFTYLLKSRIFATQQMHILRAMKQVTTNTAACLLVTKLLPGTEFS